MNKILVQFSIKDELNDKHVSHYLNMEPHEYYLNVHNTTVFDFYCDSYDEAFFTINLLRKNPFNFMKYSLNMYSGEVNAERIF